MPFLDINRFISSLITFSRFLFAIRTLFPIPNITLLLYIVILVFALSSLLSGENPALITRSPPSEFVLVAIDGVATDDVASVGGFETS